MPDATGIRAGRAYVELFTDDKTGQGLHSAEQNLSKYSKQVSEVQKKLKSAEPGSAQAKQLSGVLSGLQERADTSAQALAGRQSLAERLAAFKAARNIESYTPAPLAPRGGTGLSGLRDAVRAGGDEDGAGGGGGGGGGHSYADTVAHIFGGRKAAKYAKLAGGAAGGALAVLAGLKVAMIGVNAVQDHYLSNLYSANGQTDKAAELSLKWFESIDKIPVVGEYINTLFGEQIAKQKELVELGKRVREGTEASMKGATETAFQNRIAGMTGAARKLAEIDHDAQKRIKEEQQKLGDAQSAQAKGIDATSAIAAAKQNIKFIEQQRDLQKELAVVEEQHRRASDAISTSEAEITASMDEGVSKEWEMLRLKEMQADADARLQDAQTHDVDWENFYRRRAAGRLALKKQIEQKEQDESIAADRKLEQSRDALIQEQFPREMADMKARHAAELAEYDRHHKDRARLVELGVLAEDTFRKRLLESQANEEKSAVQRRDKAVQDMAINLYRQLTIAQRGFTPEQWEWFDLSKQLQQLGATKEQIAAIKELFGQMKAAQLDRSLADQWWEVAMKIRANTHELENWDIAAERFKRQNPNATPEQVRQAYANAKVSELADFAKGEMDSIETPLEKFKRFREKLEEAVKVDLIPASKRELLLANELARLSGGKLMSVRGTFSAAEARRMGEGDASVKLLEYSAETARNTKKLVEKAGPAAFK